MVKLRGTDNYPEKLSKLLILAAATDEKTGASDCRTFLGGNFK